MKSDAGESSSVWMQTADIEPIVALQGDEEADVCIVGAGIAGLTTAYCLAREGHSVVVLDDGPIAGGETSRTTAHLVSALDFYYHELETLHGKEGTRLAAESHSAAIDQIERIVAEADIECDFLRLDGYLFAANDDDAELLSRELQVARRAGLRVEHVEHVPVDFHDFGGALRFPGQAQFHPLKYIDGLSCALRESGVRIYTGFPRSVVVLVRHIPGTMLKDSDRSSA